MNLWQALILGIIQGVGELFPVSSLAQTILLPALLRWQIDQKGSDFLAFVVALHLATAVALVLYFWKDWLAVCRAFVGGLRRGKPIYDADSKFAWLLIAGTVVVGGVGAAFEKRFRMFFDNPDYYWLVAAILIVNGVFMIIGDLVKRRAQQQNRRADEMTLIEGAAVGAMQTFALFPGISRSGVTIVGGLLAGLSYEEASRFSFMLATPVIGLAALLKVPSLLKDPRALHLAIPSAVLAGVTAYLSVAFLMRYFRHNRLSPFGYYCIVFGGIAMGVLLGR
ncbi:MAG TPA: undecaprenyl-diphosphate phosphatase [Tepidisphaeraceae bacterium]|nr:undecaprenyl-diphosphate phosphatase [Tepidisphaeraceae bacterium]